MRHKGNIMDRRIRLRTVNPFITCYLCKGYLIDATTVTECLHTFCKSCIVQFLKDKNVCPKCGEVIHQSHPMNYISHDRTLQDIVYKLVPRLQTDEREEQVAFYKRRGLPLPASVLAEAKKQSLVNSNHTSDQQPKEEKPSNDTQGDCHRSDEQVNLALEFSSSATLSSSSATNAVNKGLKALPRKYLRLSTYATINHIKKYIAIKALNSINKFSTLDILCNEEILGKDHTLKFICVTRWRHKNIPLTLQYRQKVDIR